MVVTGASKGVGEAIAQHFVQEGWCVAALARDVKALEVEHATTPGLGDLLPLACDVSDSAAVRDAIDKACEHFACDAPTVLVNNAALYEKKSFDKFSLEMIDQMVDVNLKGAMYATHAVLPRMLRAKQGRVIFINSVAGLPTWTTAGESVYCASKHGLSGFADALANELQGTGVLVTSVHPGGIDTPLQVAAGAPEDVRARFLTTSDVVACVGHIVASDPRVLYKRIEVFGSSFWH